MITILFVSILSLQAMQTLPPNCEIDNVYDTGRAYATCTEPDGREVHIAYDPHGNRSFHGDVLIKPGWQIDTRWHNPPHTSPAQ